ncbi:hypothetical protein BH09MYX1_BH09MYX1_10400 [soil metagenome]
MSNFFSIRAALLVAVVTCGVVAATGCGRSGLDDYLPTDASADAPSDTQVIDAGTCNPSTCPSGCCDASGQCRVGGDFSACGSAGGKCEDCGASGFDFCDPDLRQCAKDLPGCDALSCPSGCCFNLNGQGVCVSGSSSAACGSGGQQCADCAQAGSVCDTTVKKCAAPKCGPQNCKGCCAGDTCLGGSAGNACGKGGLVCNDCTSKSQTCNQTTGACDGPPPTCNAQTCPSGCCQGNNCIPSSNTTCGTAGKLCQNCTLTNGTCSSGTCVVTPTCTPQNCASGCCQAGTCFAGFTNNRCGSSGNNCTDCTQQASVCNTGVTPRVCNNQQTTCPAAFPSCAGNVTTSVLPVTKNLCTSQDLADAQSACAGGAGTFACDQFFSTILSIKPQCGACLKPFDYTFFEATGIYNCVAAAVTTQCNHNTGCATSCQDTSCVQCPANSVDSCRTSVRQGGQCQQYFVNTQCAIQGLQSPQGSFCAPQGNFGNWLHTVGGHYCGP